MRRIVVLLLICTSILTAQAITQSLMKNLESLVRTGGCWEPLVPHTVSISPALLPCPSLQQRITNFISFTSGFISSPFYTYRDAGCSGAVSNTSPACVAVLLWTFWLWGVPWTVQKCCKNNKINEFSCLLHYSRVLADLLKFRVPCYFLHETYIFKQSKFSPLTCWHFQLGINECCSVTLSAGTSFGRSCTVLCVL